MISLGTKLSEVEKKKRLAEVTWGHSQVNIQHLFSINTGENVPVIPDSGIETAVSWLLIYTHHPHRHAMLSSMYNAVSVQQLLSPTGLFNTGYITLKGI